MTDTPALDGPRYGPAAGGAPQQIIMLLHGVGADGVMWLRPSTIADARMELHNADGSIPEMCGNGLRCLVKYAVDEAGLRANPLRVETLAGVLSCAWRQGDDGRVASVRVQMGPVVFPWGAMRPVACGGTTRVATAAVTGNPHLVFLVDPSEDPAALAAEHGPSLKHLRAFPEGVNVEFARRRGPRPWQLAVFERGAGLTQACGTGATATAAVLVRAGEERPGEPIRMELPGGDLEIEIDAGPPIDGANAEPASYPQAWMEGPAAELYRGELSPELERVVYQAAFFSEA